jgi:acetyltransferase-like isoleucine patch superfamily enzyme
MRIFSKKRFFTKDGVKGEQFSIGDFTYGSLGIRNYDSKTKLTVGRYCSFAAQVSILLGGEHRLDLPTTYPFAEIADPWPEARDITGMTHSKGDITIGNDVWVGYGATILSGVTIGDGVVIGAGALVCRDVEPYAIIGGNPAKVIRMRFDEQTVSRLLKLSWWNWPEEKVRENLHLLCSPDVEALLKAHNC